MWRIEMMLAWLWEYLTLTPKKHYEVVYKLECLLCHATGGKYSKATYSLNDMYSMVSQYIDECCDEVAAEAEETWRNDNA